MALMVAESTPSDHMQDMNVPAPVTNNTKKLAGISYIPDKIEVAEDMVLMNKIGRELLDFIQILTQLLDMMHLVKTRHLKTMIPMPRTVVHELKNNRSKGPNFKSFDKKLLDAPNVSASVEALINKPGYPIQHRIVPQTRQHEPQHAKQFPFANHLVEITGKKCRPLWQTVVLEKPEEINIMPKKKPKEESYTHIFNAECRTRNLQITRTKSETTHFSIKFAMTHKDLISKPSKQMHRQMEMMVASHEGFRTVEEHKAYLSTLESHWFNNYLQDVVKIGLLTCHQTVEEFKKLARHYDMNYNSLPFAKAKLCLVVMSLPFWDIARIETQRAVEFILENILLLPEKPLNHWLHVRGIPYVVFPAYSAEDFMVGSLSEPEVHTMEVVEDGGDDMSESIEGGGKAEDQGQGGSNGGQDKKTNLRQSGK